MPCTTILVGKNATYDGSTMIARNDDAGGNDHFTPKKMIVVQPKEQPRVYKAVLSSVEIPLPENHFASVPSMALILLVKVQSRVFTAKCSEPQVGTSNGMDEGSGVTKFLSLRTET